MTEHRMGIVSYAAHIPAFRLSRSEIGSALNNSPARGDRVVASFDEDSTTLGVAAASAALGGLEHLPDALYFATTTPAYADKTNATAIHAALALPDSTFAADTAGAGRSAWATLRLAAATGSMAVLSDVIVGRPGSFDETAGGDGAAAFVFGDADRSLAVILGAASLTAEFLDRWLLPVPLPAGSGRNGSATSSTRP